MNRIHVVADHQAISGQARTYAEYRVFSALTRQTLKFRCARDRAASRLADLLGARLEQRRRD